MPRNTIDSSTVIAPMPMNPSVVWSASSVSFLPPLAPSPWAANTCSAPALTKSRPLKVASCSIRSVPSPSLLISPLPLMTPSSWMTSDAAAWTVSAKPFRLTSPSHRSCWSGLSLVTVTALVSVIGTRNEPWTVVEENGALNSIACSPARLMPTPLMM